MEMRKKRILPCILLIAVLLALAGCSPAEPEAGGETEPVVVGSWTVDFAKLVARDPNVNPTVSEAVILYARAERLYRSVYGNTPYIDGTQITVNGENYAKAAPVAADSLSDWRWMVKKVFTKDLSAKLEAPAADRNAAPVLEQDGELYVWVPDQATDYSDSATVTSVEQLADGTVCIVVQAEGKYHWYPLVYESDGWKFSEFFWANQDTEHLWDDSMASDRVPWKSDLFTNVPQFEAEQPLTEEDVQLLNGKLNEIVRLLMYCPLETNGKQFEATFRGGTVQFSEVNRDVAASLAELKEKLGLYVTKDMAEAMLAETGNAQNGFYWSITEQEGVLGTVTGVGIGSNLDYGDTTLKELVKIDDTHYDVTWATELLENGVSKAEKQYRLNTFRLVFENGFWKHETFVNIRYTSH